jgi:hypothetical protein
VTKLKTEDSFKNLRSRENWFRHKMQENKILNNFVKENSTKSSFFFPKEIGVLLSYCGKALYEWISRRQFCKF